MVAGALLGGAFGAVLALVAVVSTHRRPTGPVAAAAALLLVAAAVATLVEAPVEEPAVSSSFAAQRPVASATAAAAGILVLVVTVTLAIRSRRRDRVESSGDLDPRERDGEPEHVGDLDPGARDGDVESRSSWGARARALAGPVAVGAIVAGALLLAAPDPPASTRAVADSVALGSGWSVGGAGQALPDGTEPPLPVVVLAVAPGGAPLWTALGGLVAMALAAAAVRRRSSHRMALVAAAIVGLGLVAVRADLAAALAAALMAATVWWGHPADRTLARSVLAGAAFGGVCLCVPGALFLLPVLTAALTLHPTTGEVSAGQGAIGTGAALAVVAPWQLWIVSRFSTWAPAAEVRYPISVVLAAILPVVVVAVAELASRRRRAAPADPDRADPDRAIPAVSEA